MVDLNKKEGTMKHFLICLIIFSLVCIAIGCTHLGIADKESMMERWRGKPVTENLLDDINRWGNWYAQGEKQYPAEYAMEKPEEIKIEKVAPNKAGKSCLKQAETKLNILKELGIPAKLMHCVITRNDPWHPSGHAFVVATINGKDYIMDNGAVQDIVWEYREAIASTWGVEQIEEW